MFINSLSFTKWVSLGWWSSFSFFFIQTLVIEIFSIAATPWVGFLFLAAFTILTFSGGYDKSYRFSPYSGILKMLNKQKK
jgi:hypothetical protein